MKRSDRGSHKRLRRGLLALLLTAVAGLAGLYLLGRQGAPAADGDVAASATGAPASADPASDAAQRAENVVASSDAFDFTQSIEGQPIFSVHGDRFRTMRDGTVELAGVRFQIYRESTSYSVASDAASYDSNSQEAILTGNVRLTGGEMEIDSGRLQLSRGGKFLSAEGPIAMRHGQYWRGEASQLEFDVALDLLTMRGPVVMAGQLPAAEPMSIQAGKVVLNRSERVLRAKGEVTASHGASHFTADEADLLLAEDGETPTMLILEGSLTGSYIPAMPTDIAGAAERIDFRGAKLTVRFGEQGLSEPQEMSLEGRNRNLALIESVAGELIHGLASRALWLEFEGGRPKSAQSTEPVYFAEYHRGVDEPLRSGRADRADAEFGPSGGISRVVLIGGVTLTDPRFRGWGEQALFDLAAERSELLGEPARTESSGGELVAPHIVYARKTGLLTADRGVRGVLERGSRNAAAGVGFRADLPIEFQAEEAIFSDAPRSFFLKGKVRAWQGKSLLLANQVHGEEAEERLSAAGSVRTLIDLHQSSVPSAPGALTEAAAMTEVIADLLSYRKNESTLTYTGGVRLSQGTRTLTSDELVAELDDKQQVEGMLATGKVLLRDTAAGRTIQASTASYDVSAESIELLGNPVAIKDDSGASLTGKRAIYDLKSGSARLVGSAP